MTIVIAGEIDLPPENRAAALAGARDLIAGALAEQGCRHYAWTADPQDGGRIHVFEEWASTARGRSPGPERMWWSQVGRANLWRHSRRKSARWSLSATSRARTRSKRCLTPTRPTSPSTRPAGDC